MNRPPDSRANLGQRLEDLDDSVVEGRRLDTRGWITKLRRGDPTSRTHKAIVAGIAGGLLDELWEIWRGDPQALGDAWMAYLAGYIDRGDEDSAADAQPVAEPPAKPKRQRKGKADA